ncbi:MAG: hypothetical protein QF903_07870 [Planctomycetota bacterium]|jgi:hypothetical protein|nr:hypothetical protein [Planctomycetota bacterium]MDP6989382.1 hypothetical protein [Planctomycetota bacterium]
MDVKQVEVRCPGCAHQLTVDVRTSTVLRAIPPGEVDEEGKTQIDPSRWDAATEQVSERVAEASDKLDAALEKERDRESRFDALFDRARDKASRREEEEPD